MYRPHAVRPRLTSLCRRSRCMHSTPLAFDRGGCCGCGDSPALSAAGKADSLQLGHAAWQRGRGCAPAQPWPPLPARRHPGPACQRASGSLPAAPSPWCCTPQLEPDWAQQAAVTLLLPPQPRAAAGQWAASSGEWLGSVGRSRAVPGRLAIAAGPVGCWSGQWLPVPRPVPMRRALAAAWC